MKSGALWMCFCVFLVLLGSLESSSAVLVPMANESQGSPGTRSTHEAQSQWVDCIQASEMCSQDSRCSPRYRVMRQCLVGKEKDAMLDNNRDCKAALEVLHNSSLYDCRCKRAMKNELQCLQNYWTIHMGLNEGGDMEDSSPYEPVAPNRQPDVFGLASISSGMHTLTPKPFQCPEAEKDCNPCLNATKACNLNSLCKRHRSSYITTCSRSDTNKGESCNRKRCHKTLRAFMDRVPPELSQRLIFCPCQSEGCAERRRQTIVPDCSYTDKEKPNCLELRRVCRADALCRSRLADYVANCWMTPNTVGTCPNQDNHQACLNSLARLIVTRYYFHTGTCCCPDAGTEMTPNYVDNSFTNWTISPWCNCIGSGNQEEECMNFLRYFSDNTCLRNAIQAYGMDDTAIKNMTVSEPSVTSKAMNEWMDSIQENPNPNPSSSPPISKERNGGLALGEDRSPCLHANVLALLPSPALALILAQLVL